MAKDFKKIAAQQAPIYSMLLGGEQEAQKVHEVQEVQPTTEMRTQGKKGEKLPRINMAFSPANHDFITVMARLKGVSITQYVNSLIDADREANSELYNKAKELLNM